MRYLLIAACLLSACQPVPAEWEPEGKRLVWARSRLPLKVAVSAELADWSTEITTAAREINSAVGCPLLAVGAPADVSVELGALSPGAEDVDGEAYGTGIGAPEQSATVVLVGAASSVGVLLVAEHEFGHVLGLAHDLRSESIMDPQPTRLADRLPLPTLSDRDAAGLAAIYCP